MLTGQQFYALADDSRRAIFEQVARKPTSVVERAAGFPISRPGVSQHLKVLKDAGLVKVTKDGTRSIYCVDLDGVRAMRDYLDKFWDRALARFKTLAEKE